MRLLVLGLGAAMACSGSAMTAANAAAPNIENEYAVIQALDKISARTSRLVARVDEPVSFGSLEIVVKACRTRPPEETPEDAAFLQIVDDSPELDPVLAFSGWMFSSSPAVSALDHPVFDVWVVDCAQQPPVEDEDFAAAERGVVSLPEAPPRPPEVPEQRRE